MEIGGIQKTTLIDFPGKISATVFLCGCNFRCPFCYSSELVLPFKIKKQPKIPQKEFFNFLKKRKNFLDGVCITGGEPLLHQEIFDFCKKIKKIGYSLKIDTNGSFPGRLFWLVKKKLIDYVAMDIKAPPKKYNFYSGVKVNISNIQKSIKILKEGVVDYEFRTTVAAGLTGKDIKDIVSWIGPSKRYFLQKFDTSKQILNSSVLKLPLLKDAEIEKLVLSIKNNFEVCQFRK